MHKNLTSNQSAIVDSPIRSKIFLEGIAGSGKTTCGIERMLSLMEQGVSGRSILILIPQRTLAVAYDQALRTPGVVAGGMVTILTIGGLAQRMVNLFWPLIVESAGFTQANHPPIFLTLETSGVGLGCRRC